MSDDNYIQPSASQTQALARRAHADGDRGGPTPVLMLNLIKFRDQALAPYAHLSGKNAYKKYQKAAMAVFDHQNVTLLAYWPSAKTVIGPPHEDWDVALLVRYSSRAVFLASTSAPNYVRRALPIRQAAIADSRLIELTGADVRSAKL